MEKRDQIGFINMYIANFALMIGFSLWRNLFNNFAVEEVGVNATQIGIIQAIREIPGLMGFVVALIVMFIAEARLTYLSVALLGLGLALTSFVSSFWGLVITCFVMSIGFHFFYPLRTAITLKLLDSSKAAHTLARYRSHAQLAGAATTGIVTVLFWLIDWMQWNIGMKHLLFAGGIAVTIVGLYLTFSNDTSLQTESEKKLRYKKRYWLYYVLQFLSGTRRHIFTTFAIFLLVKVYQMGVKEITLLLFINSVLSYFVYMKAGNIINCYGERLVLLTLYVLLIAIFMGYAYIDNLWLLWSLFVADHILFGFNLALETYFKKTALPADITSNISAGVTINHTSAIFIPIIGGVIWDLAGFEMTFLFGAAVAFISFLFCLKLERNPVVAPESVST
jgi:predicted MFS family arabinose efflux permease